MKKFLVFFAFGLGVATVTIGYLEDHDREQSKRDEIQDDLVKHLIALGRAQARVIDRLHHNQYSTVEEMFDDFDFEVMAANEED